MTDLDPIVILEDAEFSALFASSDSLQQLNFARLAAFILTRAASQLPTGTEILAKMFPGELSSRSKELLELPFGLEAQGVAPATDLGMGDGGDDEAEALDELLDIINQRMHPDAECPGQCANPLGECPIIEREPRMIAGRQSYAAVLALWPAGPDGPGSSGLLTQTVVTWFDQAGWEVHRITQVMHERGLNIAITDGYDATSGFEGCRQWEVLFTRRGESPIPEVCGPAPCASPAEKPDAAGSVSTALMGGSDGAP